MSKDWQQLYRGLVNKLLRQGGVIQITDLRRLQADHLTLEPEPPRPYPSDYDLEPSPPYISENEEKAKWPDAVITLEVGHGGHPEGFEPGAVDPITGTREWDMNKIVAVQCKAELDARGYKDVLITDEADYLYSLGAKNRKSHVFVSIHHNAFSNAEAQGSECLVSKSHGTKSDDELAALISMHCSEILEIDDRGVKKNRDLGVLTGFAEARWQNAKAGVLSESYFITGNTVDDHKKWSALAGVAHGWAIHEFLNEQENL